MAAPKDVAMQAYVNDHTTRIHYEIEAMTRRLELEKRRLQRVTKEAAAARKTLDARKMTVGLPGKLPRALRASSAGPKRQQESLDNSSASQGRPAIDDSEQSMLSLQRAGIPAAPTSSPSTSMSVLQDRLVAETKRLDENNMDNKKLRHEVDHFRQELLQLRGLFDKLKMDVKRRTGQLMSNVEEARSSKNVLRDAGQRLSIMKAQQERERAEFKTEVKSLREQLVQHEWHRKEVEVALRRGDHMGIPIQNKHDLLVPEEEMGFSEFEMSQRVLKAAFLNCIQRRHMKQHQKNIEVYDQAFATIKQSTGIERIEDIVKVFVTLENRNYSLMTYVNHMNKEIDALQASRLEHNRVSAEEEEARRKKAQARTDILESIRSEQNAVEEALAKERATCKHHHELLRSLEEPVKDMVKRIEVEAAELLLASTARSVPSAIAALPKLPTELKEDNVSLFLDWVEQAMRRWRDCLQDPLNSQPGDLAFFPSTAKNQVMVLPPKRFGAGGTQVPLVKPQEIPTSASSHHHHHRTGEEQREDSPRRTHLATGFVDDESEDEDFSERPFSLKDLRLKAEQAAMKRRRKHHTHRIRHGAEGAHNARFEVSEALGNKDPEALTAGGKPRGSELWNNSNASIGASSDDDESRPSRGPSKSKPTKEGRALRESGSEEPLGEVTEVELNDAFLKNYATLSRDELQVVADRLGMSLKQLCQIKQEFDLYDSDQSGRIDIDELRSLLVKLIDDPTEEEIQQAFRELDMDGSGEIEFFEFVEWFKDAEHH